MCPNYDTWGAPLTDTSSNIPLRNPEVLGASEGFCHPVGKDLFWGPLAPPTQPSSCISPGAGGGAARAMGPQLSAAQASSAHFPSTLLGLGSSALLPPPSHVPVLGGSL